jgi:HAMP domain-containing protein
MRVLLYRNLPPQRPPAELIDASGPLWGRRAAPAPDRAGRNRGVNSPSRWAAARRLKPSHLRLTGYDNNLLGVLLIASPGAAGGSWNPAVDRHRGAAGGILVGIALSWWATARVTRPVQLLAESAGRVAAGDWNASVAVSSSDEIGQLARAFNRMTGELVAQRERLVQAERVAAWRELARRLAHELKNPLFPLQITVETCKGPPALSRTVRRGVSRSSGTRLPSWHS